MIDGFTVGNDIARLINGGALSSETLSVILDVPVDRVNTFTAGSNGAIEFVSADHSFSSDEIARVSLLAAQLAHGFDIDDDERLKGMLESLTVACKLSLENVSLLTGLDVSDLRFVLSDPGAVSSEAKYAVAVRVSYLVNAINSARPR